MELMQTFGIIRGARTDPGCRSTCTTSFRVHVLLTKTQDKKVVASNIEAQARSASILFIWTDCDREGEHIGTEIRDIALKANPTMQVWRARFSNIERAYVPYEKGKQKLTWIVGISSTQLGTQLH